MRCDSASQGFFTWHPHKFQFAVDCDRRRGHDAVFNSGLWMLSDINFDQADLWELASYLLEDACDHLLGRVTFASARC